MLLIWAIEFESIELKPFIVIIVLVKVRTGPVQQFSNSQKVRAILRVEVHPGLPWTSLDSGLLLVFLEIMPDKVILDDKISYLV